MMNEKMINDLIDMGAKRWTKGDHDRLYITAEILGLEYESYSTGNVRYAEFKGEQISNSLAREMLASKCYIDLTTGEIVCRNYTLKCALEELLESLETAEQEQAVEETAETAEPTNQTTEEITMEKIYYIATDPDAAYGSENPICVDWFEAERLMNERYNGDEDAPAFDDVWEEASTAEIERYGTYDAGISDSVFNTVWGAALATENRDEFVSKWSLSSIWHDTQGLSRNADFTILANICSTIWDAAHMSVRDICKCARFTQSDLARRFCIPRRTVEDWCRGVSKCPDYTRLMMLELLGLFKRA